ncbi:11-S seed storage protein plant protein [Dioscorea alata]|uniref:11-S seed storage protein plant protein n=1 Tax=Dioscorea alata TaxID=55571 RepID=A0ACB7WSJ8_DIOAL|nr:11-S seed storage protein plant protein [Dioscorea alata]
MAEIKKTLTFSLALSFLIFCNVSLAQLPQQQPQQQQLPEQPSRGWFIKQQLRDCNIQQLRALEPTRRVEAEAGFTEYWNSRDTQFNCAGVSIQRTVIQPGGLLQLSFDNTARVTFIEQGQGIIGTVLPGCPESYQSFQQSEQQQQQEEESAESFRPKDRHQRIDQYRQGDIIALPPGVAHWCYNDGDIPLVTFTVFNLQHSDNQLDLQHREFLLAGRERRSQQSVQEQETDIRRVNLLAGFDTDELTKVLRATRETVQSIQSDNDRRGHIVFVQQGFHVSRPARQQQQQECGSNKDEKKKMASNTFTDAVCSLRIRENINDPSRADVFTPRGGRITNVNSQKLPILKYLQMSVLRGVLYRNAILGPRWIMNAHSLVYVTRGSARVQIVGSQGKSVFDGELRQGQVIVVPQNFAVIVKAKSNEGFQWVAFRTNDNAISSPIFGKFSVFRGLPVDVIASAYNISRDQAWRVKYSRAEELHIHAPRTQSRTNV